ncbi:hypothetical protein [Paenibacillus sp. JDR-2]|uniref:hypothetical protein n=1 Tax=Paenibacillus sp. (strain JDR-2) TaxID=324057 RepID=UPI0002D583A6|nr:hypothetical protein [Paenibacillus sp. JDR-2]
MTYPAPDGAVGWYPIGFERGNDSALDVMNWDSLKLVVHSNAEEIELAVKAEFADNRSIFAHASLAGEGYHEVKIKLTDFELEHSKSNIWRFLTAVELQGNAELISAKLQRGETIAVVTGVLGKSAGQDGTASYEMTVLNCTDRKQNVAVKQIFQGWESLVAEITPKRFILPAGGQQDITVKVLVHDAMVPGGHEATRLQFIANGDGSSSVEVEFKTLRKLEHPYIYHNKQQWEETKAKIDRYPQFKAGYDQIIADAEAWIVKPPLPLEERDYCYDTHEEHNIMSAAYAYALTKERKYAEKVAAFLRYFIEEETGYPKKKKGCSQSYVQEGHFFQHLAIPYDIIYDAGVLTENEHQGVENVFRIYMDILDRHIRNGHISNWLLSEITGAFYCALAIEDMDRALRFLDGPGGIIQQFRFGAFNDGWWHECSVGYNVWVSSMMIHVAHALLPFGINLLHTHFPISYSDEVNSTYNGEPAAFRFGMYNKKWGGNLKSYICIKDMFDATIPFLDYRGVLFGISDSDEKKLEGVHFGSTFDLAYTYYKDPEYIPIIRQNSYADPIFGHGELPDYESKYKKYNAYADNVGVAMLRSQTVGREQEDQIQAVVRYGSHGYAHGHFDRTGLLSVMRYGRSFFNPEHVWWGYAHFMYKFYVQNSITKNMVVVDGKMQVPSDSKRLLFYSGEALQAVAIETNSHWSYPPYGGMVYKDNETLTERAELNHSWLPRLENNPGHGMLSEFTEPIKQKRVMGVLDDYIVLFDYAEGEQEHQYDSLFQIKGYQGLKANDVQWVKHTSQLTTNPLADGQFVTDCSWYEVSGTSKASFVTIFGEGEDLRGTRSFHNTPGLLKMDVHTAWPQQSTQIIGRAAEDHGYMIPLKYAVVVDGETKASEQFNAWLISDGTCEVDVKGAAQLQLRVHNGPVYTEQRYPYKTKQGLFWGEAYLVLADGSIRSLSDLELLRENIDSGYGIGKDYEGGRVTIVGHEYPNAVPTSPINHEQEGIITLDLTGLDAVRFIGRIGADAFPGDEAQRRKTYAVRINGKIGRYTTIVEPFETGSMIESVNATDADSVTVHLKDGRTQVITVHDIAHDNQTLQLDEYRDGKKIRQETASGK